MAEMTMFQTVGGPLGGPDPFALKPLFVLTAAEWADVATIDPASETGGARLFGIKRRVERRSRSGHRTEDLDRLEDLIERCRAASKRPAERTSYQNPTRLDGARPARGLEPGDFAFVSAISEAVARGESVADDDAAYLAELEAAAVTESERRVVQRVLAPVRRRHDLLEEQTNLRNEIADATAPRRSPEVRAVVEPLLTRRLIEERRAERAAQLDGVDPELRDRLIADAEAEARRDAPKLLDARFAALDAEVAERTSRARERLGELATGADPVSSASLPSLPDPALAGARERGRAHREARVLDRHALDAFPVVGGANGSAG